MATRKTTKPKRPAATPEAAKCPVCKGTGEVPVTVRVGRKRRPAGQQTGFCLPCLGSGHKPQE